MNHYRCVVWIDHREARVFSFSKEDVESKVIRAPKPRCRIHRKAGSIGPGKLATDDEFFDEVEHALRESGEFLILGPGTAKLELIRHIHAHARDLDQKLVGVETSDHPSDNQIVAHARRYFVASDRMHHSNADILRET